MDAKFLEFYGRFLLNAAKGQQQIEQFSDWFNQGINSGFKEMEDLFKRCYQIQDPDDSAQNQQTINDAMAAFRDSFSACAAQMGWVLASEHDALKEKIIRLEQENKAQKEKLDQLNQLLGLKENASMEDFFNQMKQIQNSQTKEFQALLKTFEQVLDLTGKSKE